MEGPIYRAAFDGDLATIRRLLAEGVDLEACNDMGQTPLHLAIENGNVEVVKFLLEAGADPDGLMSGCVTPLCHAIEVEGDSARQLDKDEQSTAIIELLLAHGADVNHPCVWDRVHGKSPLAEAWHQGNWKAVELLTAAGAKPMDGEVLRPVPGRPAPYSAPRHPPKPGYEWRLGLVFLRLGVASLAAAGVCQVAAWMGRPWGNAVGPLTIVGLIGLCAGGVYLVANQFLP